MPYDNAHTLLDKHGWIERIESHNKKLGVFGAHDRWLNEAGLNEM
jgi:hypothetical protein